jgi:hypothetical protein
VKFKRKYEPVSLLLSFVEVQRILQEYKLNKFDEDPEVKITNL